MTSAQPGFFGKLPSRGDYVAQALPRSFLDPFEAWLHRAMAASQTALAARWQELFHASPAWRFVLAGGLCGEETVAGVMLPSADRTARSYPFIIAAALAGRPAPVEVATAAPAWFERAGQLGRALVEGQIEPGSAGRFLAQLGAPSIAAAPRPLPLGTATPGWRVAGTLPRDGVSPLAQLLDCVAGTMCLGYSVWWTNGAAVAEPSLLLCDGLPAPARFVAFIDGRWADHGWPSRP